MFTSTHSSPSRRPVFRAQAVHPRRQSTGHPGVKMHLRRFVFRQARLRQQLGLRHHVEVHLVPRRFRPVPWQTHSVFVFRRKAPDLPPACLRFQQIAQRVLRLRVLQGLRFRNRQITSPRINVLQNRVRARRQRKFARGGTARRKQKCAHGQPQQNKCSFHD